jgi:Mlc titration factor MtfA (ptsG expression regulator)
VRRNGSLIAVLQLVTQKFNGRKDKDNSMRAGWLQWVYLVLYMTSTFGNFFKKLLGKGIEAGTEEMRIPEVPIPTELVGDYAAIIGRFLPYYNKLIEANRERFLKRVYNFRRIKSFHFIGLEEREEIAILVCGAAVQVSFGLKNYMLPFFKDIYLLSDAYDAINSREKYIGHVSPSGIYISWKHFVQGFSDYTDGFNVALHEMAHALHHENFIKETGVDWDFRKDFDKLNPVFGPLMTQAIVQRKSYLRGYAFTNFHEFWAVSVENFFENPQGLKDNLPQLFSILCETLNQDPLHLDELPVTV